MKLNLVDARLLGVDLQPNEDGGKAVINVSAPLTPTLAEKLRRKEMLYDDKGVAREFDGSIKIGLVMSSDWDALIEMANAGSESFSHQFAVERIRNFKFTHGKGAEDEDSQLRLEFSIHVAILTHVENAYRLFHAANKDKFDCVLESKQCELFEESQEAEAVGPVQTTIDGNEKPAEGKRTGRSGRRGRPKTEAEVSASVQ